MSGYRDFESARDFSRDLRISCAREWREYSRSDKRPKDIPSHPDRHYKTCGWVGWMDWLNTNNVAGGQRSFDVDHNYFKKWSRNMAYILGFWFTDGCIIKNVFSITQHYKDKYILEEMLEEMSASYRLKKHGENNLYFRISSKEIVDDIIRIGGSERKTYTIKFPDVPIEYMPDFIRGLWDGDGSISFYRSAYSSSFVSANKKFLEDLLLILRKEIPDFKGAIYKNQNVHMLCAGVNDTRRLSQYLYRDVHDGIMHLKRKKEKFMSSGPINIASFNKEFYTFEEASKIGREHKIVTSEQWKKDCKTISDKLPVNADFTYADKWDGWKKFLGTEYLDFNEARKHVRNLRLKNQIEWRDYAKNDRPVTIPSNPWSVYSEWVNLADWLGKNECTT